MSDAVKGKFPDGSPPLTVSDKAAQDWLAKQMANMPASALKDPDAIQAYLAAQIAPGSQVTIGDKDYNSLSLLAGFTAIANQYHLPPDTQLAFMQQVLGGTQTDTQTGGAK
jgi:hypothetical protein